MRGILTTAPWPGNTNFNRARQQLELQRHHYGGGARIEVNRDALNTLMFQRDLAHF